MTNADKYLKDGIREELIADLANYIRTHNTDTRSYLGILHAYFDKPIKPTLTEDEKVILKSMPHLKSVSRNRENDIFFQYQQEQKYSIWGETIVGFNYLFQFIQPRRRI